MLSSRYSRRRCPKTASPDAEELSVFFTSSLLENINILHNADSILPNSAMSLKRNWSFWTEDAFPLSVRAVSVVSFLSSHGCPRRRDHCCGSLHPFHTMI